MELINFLLPKTELDWIFFLAIAFCFVITIISTFIVRRSIDKALDTSSASESFTDEANISNYLANDKWDKVFENGAGFVLILGLLGTFLGIGLAIQDASKVIVSLNSFSNGAATSNAMDTVGKLAPVLSDIGTKFKISAWGIGSHILIRLIVPFFGIETIRQKFTADQLKKINFDRKQQKDNFYKETVKFFRENKDINLDILEQLNRVANIPANIDSSLMAFTKSIEDYNKNSIESAHNFVNIVNDLKVGLDKLLLDIDKSVKSIDIKANESFTDLNSLTKSIVTDSMKNLTETNNQAIELIKNLESFLHADNFTSLISDLNITNENLHFLTVSISEIRSIFSSELIPIFESMNKINEFLDINLVATEGLNANLKTNEEILFSLNKSSILMEKVNRNLLRSTIDRQIKLDN
ncbi:hypothetical protein [Psychrobacter sp. R86515]|uniref:hypothetical protein n=1 Tax=unclassified Psychrobacter TaxID=196806 RepID=UPI0036D2C871